MQLLRPSASSFDKTILQHTEHRPWPMPDRRWVMTQTIHDLLFAHWACDPGGLRKHVPAEFELDVFAGQAWIGIVPFWMTNVAARGMPALPGISTFPELNVRTYVRVEDKPGIYFFSLDAGSRVAVLAGRLLLNLPYHAASMTVADDGPICYESRRTGGVESEANFLARYEPKGTAFNAPAGSLEEFLTERYCLYHLDRRGEPYRLEIHHPPWKLQPASAQLIRNNLGDVNGLHLPDTTPLTHFVRRQDIVAWSPSAL
jgi:uncharacterized protein YqjF (DUF2071 family)